MRLLSSCRLLGCALAVALSVGACARPPSAQHQGNPAGWDAPQTGRTINGHTYTDAPVDVKLGPNTFRIPANYLDSQIAPWPGEGVSLVIEWPDMTPSAPGARANPRTNDFRKEISVLINYIDRAPIERMLERYSSNDSITEDGSVEEGDPRDRLDLRRAEPEVMGLTPYAIDESEMAAYARKYEDAYGKTPVRNPAFEGDWYVSRGDDGELTTFIKCDSKQFRQDGVRVVGNELIDEPGDTAASCIHYFVDVDSKLSISMDYKRAFLQDWKRIEVAVREVLKRSRSV